MKTAKIVRITADGIINSGSVVIVSAVQVIGGTAATILYDATSAVAANKKAIAIASALGNLTTFNTPIRFNNLYIDAGTGATEVLVHTV